MNPPNPIASDTLVKAIARAITNVVDYPDSAHRIAQAALTAITEAGYAIVRDDELRMANGALSAHGMAPLMAIVSKEGK